MHWELIDALRCPVPHEDSWLIATADRTEGRHIVEGTLGCPICHARYPVHDGIADFSGGEAAPSGAGLRVEDEEGATLKLAAMLDLRDARGHVLLFGQWAALASPLRALVPVAILAVNPPAGVGVGGGVSAIRAGARLPLAPAAARGAAVDEGSATLLDAAIVAVQQGGRVVGDASLVQPSELSILARDDRHWVGTRRAAERLLQLVRKGE